MKLRLCGALMLGFFAVPAHAADGDCTYAGKTYMVGSTICECPSLSGDGGRGTGGAAKITSRRMVCNRAWQPDTTLCLNLDYPRSSATAVEDLPKYHNLYCGGILANSPEEIEKTITTASKPAVIGIVQAVCKRFGAAADACKALLTVLATTN